MERKAKARPARRIEGVMNKLEAEFYVFLKEELSYQVIRFEPLRFRLAPKTTYTPDFQVFGPGHEISFFEVKGFWRDDARVKLKMAAELYPEFNWWGCTKDKNKEWTMERIGS